MKKVAVYGSLLTDLGNHGLLEESTLLGDFRVILPFKMISLGGFPGLLESDISNYISLEIYEVDEDTSKSLDRLEGYPHFYNKKVIPITEGYEAVEIYFLNNERGYNDHTVVESGDWKAFYINKQNKYVLSQY